MASSWVESITVLIHIMFLDRSLEFQAGIFAGSVPLRSKAYSLLPAMRMTSFETGWPRGLVLVALFTRSSDFFLKIEKSLPSKVL